MTAVVGGPLLGITFNILNSENRRGTIRPSAYWRLVIRGVFLLIVVIFNTGSRASGRFRMERPRFPLTFPSPLRRTP